MQYSRCKYNHFVLLQTYLFTFYCFYFILGVFLIIQTPLLYHLVIRKKDAITFGMLKRKQRDLLVRYVRSLLKQQNYGYLFLL